MRFIKCLFALLAFMFCGLNAGAAKPVHGFEVPLWDNKTVSAGGSYEPVMTCYLPEHPNGTAVIVCPGGGYDHLAINHEGHDLAPWFNARGVACFVLKYRLPVNYVNYPLIDARRAMLLVRRNAAKWKINKNKVGIMGCSAGGHLASMLATDSENEDARPDFQILLYPVITFQANLTNAGTRNKLVGTNPTEAQVQAFSTDKRVDAKTPKAFIALSADDRAVVPENSILYFNALWKRGIPAALHIYPSGGHGWGFKDSFKYKADWTFSLQNWLKDIADSN